MKKYISIIIVAALATILVSCEKQSAGVTRITYYPTLTILGDNPYMVAMGATYADPGYEAEMNGEDVSGQVNVDLSGVDMSTPGIYSVNYSIVNSDGIMAVSSRNVWVINTTGGIANVYNSNCRNGSGSRNYNVPFVVEATEYPGVYLVEDLIGGFYCKGVYPGYEPNYDFHCETYLQINADNSLAILQTGYWYGDDAGWFDYDNFTGAYDPVTGKFSWYIDGIYVTLTPYTL